MSLFRLPMLIALIVAIPQDAAELPEPTVASAEHQWLKQLVGNWTVTSEAIMAPGAEPMMMESTESVRALGDLWVVSEGEASFGDTQFQSMMTLGYDPQKKAFVGTWVDTMQTHLWVYRGQLDQAKKVLTLNTEGPGIEDPTKMASYRDVFELVSPDHKVLTSWAQGEDGEWTQFMKADFRRKK